MCLCWCQNMLSEGFLTTLRYRRDGVDSPATTQLKNGPTAPPAETCVDGSFLWSPRIPRSIKAGQQKAPEQPKTCLLTVPGSAITIPRNSSDEYWGLELYRSWCCPSLCKNYPDLQIGGDQLGDRSSQSPQWLAPSEDSPLLCSQDLGEMEALPGPEPPGDRGPWLGGQAQHDNGYMVMETSMQGTESIRGQERLSNSMLNGYLETKLLEVYRQHMQDSLVHDRSSVSLGLVPTRVPGSLAPPSGQWMTQEERLASGSIHYLSTCSLPSHSHFSSPNLRISAPHSNDQKETNGQ
ncbi:TLR adapter interacting with SLC15A4 on the lysosome isoform X2 [Clupea harengus]|uniref:TLR adapter interacting with SLC15A4 on the lysosome isoform X2 n=1 Tax=Clupea harengus TaxID=7950 RepID=A0A6P8FV03_CLUHA|nr:TLR adapter interacting with SLC15A4 on the lysosome isoform X2 [Clupea harengus]